MTEDEAIKSVGGHAVARFAHAFDGEFGRGRVISYSLVPTLTIEREDGSRFSWRHDLCDPISAEVL